LTKIDKNIIIYMQLKKLQNIIERRKCEWKNASHGRNAPPAGEVAFTPISAGTAAAQG
jgi:hypothetical protein